MSHAQSLFWYGLKANLIKFFGVLVMCASFFLFLVHYILAIIGIIIGIVIIFKGKAMRFEYQMNSGSIIHRGDW